MSALSPKFVTKIVTEIFREQSVTSPSLVRCRLVAVVAHTRHDELRISIGFLVHWLLVASFLSPALRLINRLVVLCFVATLGAFEHVDGQASRPITSGTSLIDSLSAGTIRSFHLDLLANQFVRLEADQQTTDAVLTVFGPVGEFITMADATPRGPEPLTFTTRSAGRYRIDVTSFERKSGTFAITYQRVEPAATTPPAVVDQTMAAFTDATPGAVVALFQRGKTVFAKGYGMADLEHGVRNATTTPFHVASLSKQFTAFAVAMLVDEGRLSLDDDIRTHVPEVPDFGRRITLRHLLHHTSGLRDQWDLWAMGGGLPDDVIRQKDILALVARQRELNFAPGTEFLYSNTGYTLLATAVERVTGTRFSEWMATRVFRPLRMSSTMVRDDVETIVPNRALSYYASTDGYRNAGLNFGTYGATGLITTAEDLGRWLENFRSRKVGSPSVHARMQERGVLANGDTLTYALGINVDRQRGLMRMQHGGVDAGFMTVMAYYPEIDAGVVVLSNTATFYPMQTGFAFAASFFGDAMSPAPVPTAWTGMGAPRNEPQLSAPSKVEIASYAGRYYSDELEAVYTLVADGGRLIARHRRLGDIVLSRNSNDRFGGDVDAFAGAVFERSASGKVTGFRVSSQRARAVLFRRLD